MTVLTEALTRATALIATSRAKTSADYRDGWLDALRAVGEELDRPTDELERTDWRTAALDAWGRTCVHEGVTGDPCKAEAVGLVGSPWGWDPVCHRHAGEPA